MEACRVREVGEIPIDDVGESEVEYYDPTHYCLARVVTRSHRFSHSAPLLKSLHLLPVQCHIIFKICTITYKALSVKQPAHFHSLLTPVRQPGQLRLSDSNLLFVPSGKTNVGTSVAAPSLWNSFPGSAKYLGNITTFRHKLKTHLFQLAHPP